MKGFGVYIDEYYSSTSPLSQAAPSFNYQQWSQDKDSQIQEFLSSLGAKEGGGLGDLFSNKYLGQLQYSGAEPGVEVLGEISRLQEQYKENLMEQDAIEFPDNLGGFGLLNSKLVPYKDANGHNVYNNGEQLFMLKGRYGYKLLSPKPQYHKKMYPLAQTLWQNSINQRMHMGDFKRHLINSVIYSDDLELHVFSPLRIGGGYPSALSSWARNNLGYAYYPLHYMVGTPFEFIKGLVMGPRVDIFTKKPVTIKRAQTLISILAAGNAQKRLEAEENT